MILDLPYVCMLSSGGCNVFGFFEIIVCIYGHWCHLPSSFWSEFEKYLQWFSRRLDIEVFRSSNSLTSDCKQAR